MNDETEPTTEWREQSKLPAISPDTGWTVVFATDLAGTMPALDYISGCDAASDRTFRFTSKHLEVLKGCIQIARFEGIEGRTLGAYFSPFKGEDHNDGMCEFRIKAERGHRFLAFRCANRTLVITNGFRKPPQQETPPEAKNRARDILREYQARQKDTSPSRKARHS